MIKVSVIIPVYNAEKYLEQCIQSCVSQDFKDFEVILIDDGSTDKSREMCYQYEERYGNIKVFHKENEGVSSARNRGLNEAKGEFVTFLDSDDFLDSKMLSTMYTNIKKYEADLVICGIKLYENGKVIPIKYENKLLTNRRNIAEFFSLLNSRTNGTCNKMYRKNLINENFKTNLITGEDLYFNINYYENCNSIIVLEKALYFYRRENKQSLSKSFYVDSFENSSKLHKSLTNFLINFSGDNLDLTTVNTYFYKDTVSYLYGLVKSDISFRKKIKNIKNVCNNKNLINTLSEIKILSIKERILMKFIFKKKILFIFLTVKAHSLLKNHEIVTNTTKGINKEFLKK